MIIAAQDDYCYYLTDGIHLKKATIHHIRSGADFGETIKLLEQTDDFYDRR